MGENSHPEPSSYTRVDITPHVIHTTVITIMLRSRSDGVKRISMSALPWSHQSKMCTQISRQITSDMPDTRDSCVGEVIPLQIPLCAKVAVGRPNRSLVACPSEFVTADPASRIRVSPLKRSGIGGIGIDVAT